MNWVSKWDCVIKRDHELPGQPVRWDPQPRAWGAVRNVCPAALRLCLFTGGRDDPVFSLEWGRPGLGSLPHSCDLGHVTKGVFTLQCKPGAVGPGPVDSMDPSPPLSIYTALQTWVYNCRPQVSQPC